MEHPAKVESTKEDEDKWKVEDDLRALERAHEVRKDPERMKKCKKMMREKMKDMKMMEADEIMDMSNEEFDEYDREGRMK